MPSVELELLQTPLEQCVSVSLGLVERRRLTELLGGRFDDAPVIEDGKVLGVVATSELERLAEEGQPLETAAVRLVDRSNWLVCSVSTPAQVSQVLNSLLEDRCTFLCDAPRAVFEESGPVRGFLTISDLNKHAFRAAMYNVLAQLEARMAEAIRIQYTDPWTWIECLSEEHRVRILGSWELSKRTGLDVGPESAATLTNLLVAAGRDPELLHQFGFASKGSFDKATGGLPGVRNAIMHPARPLISKHSDVARVLRVVLVATKLHSALLKAQS